MFTGIIEQLGRVVAREGSRLVVQPQPIFRSVRLGESVSVNGVCLTVEERRAARLSFRLLPETLRGSALGSLRSGEEVHLERALRAGDRLGGHLLLGHVDGQGVVVGRAGKGSSLTLEIRAVAPLVALLVPKGPVAVDGVSLTLDARLGRDRFRVHLVAHTLKKTLLSRKKPGDRVNLEVDLILKYLRGML